jgi:HNH endonuclease
MKKTKYKDDHFYEKEYPMLVFLDELEGSIKVPEFQREIDHDKVEHIIAEYNADTLRGINWSRERQPLHVCVLSKTQYLVDGQHRITAYKRLRDANMLYGKSTLVVQFTICADLSEVKTTYSRLNINTNFPILFNDIENECAMDEIVKVKTALKKNYPKSMWGRSRGATVYHHIDDFIDKIRVDVIKQHWDITDITYANIYPALMAINDAVKGEIDNIIEQGKMDRFSTQAQIDNMRGCNFYLSFKRGVEWDLFAPVNKFRIIVRANKTKIPKKVRDDVWAKHFKTLEGVCVCCGNALRIDNYECGHVVSEYHGGETAVSNLEPICGGCNKSMGVMDMDVFKRMLA